MLQEGNRVGASRKQKKAAVEALIVESHISNPAGGDRDSQGPFQQRTSQGWKNPRNVRVAARQFFEHAKGADRGQSSGALAQDVQRSAFPGRYNQVAGQAGAILRGSGSVGDRAASAARTITGPDPNARRAALQNYLNFSHDPDALLTLARSLENATKTRTVTSPRPGVRNAVGNAVGGKTHIASGADRPGAHTAHSVRQFVRMVSAQAGTPLTIGTGTNHSKMTVDGNVSDHWSGHAADIPATGAKLIRLGRAALIAAGMSPGKARKQTGGLFNVNGHQIIFNTHIGGDHTNHLHVSAR